MRWWIIHHVVVDFPPQVGYRSSGMYERLLNSAIDAALADSPVVLIHGARQVGKTTLASARGGPSRRPLSLDRAAVLAAATSDPDGFIDGLEGPVFIDEVQRAPELFPAIKHAVDRDRSPGRFLLTGSANVLALPRLSESLAGRMAICTLWPLTQAEIHGVAGTFVDRIFDATPPPESSPEAPDIWDRVLRGGFPEAFRRPAADRRRAWFDSFIDAILQRDIRDLANIDRLSEMPRLLHLLAARTGGLLNYAGLATGLSVPQSTVKRYVGLLEAVFLIHLLPAWTSNLSGRVIKSPKAHLLDTGLASALLAVDRDRLDRDGAMRGQLLESFVVMELVKLSSASRIRPRPHHFRTTAGREVDVVLEAPDGRVVGIEVKASTSIDASAFRGLDALAQAAGPRLHRSIVLHGGTEVIPFGHDRWAVPVSSLWS
jgi:predicted AAA+ superfamily ATPase